MNQTKKKRSKQKKPTNGHLMVKESKRTIIISWGKYSVTALCLTAIMVTLIRSFA